MGSIQSVSVSPCLISLSFSLSLLLTCVSTAMGGTIQTPDTRTAPEDTMDDRMLMDDRISMAGMAMDNAACAATCAWDSNGVCRQGPIGLPKPCWVMKPAFTYLLKMTTGLGK